MTDLSYQKEVEKNLVTTSLWPEGLLSQAPVNGVLQLQKVYREIVEAEKMPSETLDPYFQALYLPMASWIAALQTNKPIIIGFNGAQGSGKSTLCKILSSLISEGFGKRVATLSIDDIYLTREERQSLAEKVHPLFKTRGVPGTHDVELGISIMDHVRNLDSGYQLPRFDKARDDRADVNTWTRVNEPLDILLFEGWCVGSRAEDALKLAHPVNALEQYEDTDGRWRSYVNQQLETRYESLFSYLDKLVFLRVPGFESVNKWRSQQEKGLADRNSSNSTMSSSELIRFIMHYERLTRHNLEYMLKYADLTLQLGPDHQVKQVLTNEG